MNRSRGFLVLVLALFTIGLSAQAFNLVRTAATVNATGCTQATPLYSVLSPHEVSTGDWQFTALAGGFGDPSYSAISYLDTWNPDPNNTVHIEWFASSEVGSVNDTLAIFNWSQNLAPGRSITQGYDGTIHPFSNLANDNQSVPGGKVHFEAKATLSGTTTPTSVAIHAEQWLRC